MSVIKDVLRQNKKKAYKGLVLLVFIGLFGCQNKLQKSTLNTNLNSTFANLAKKDASLTKVSMSKVVLRLENDQTKKHKLAELHFNFYGSQFLESDFEAQKDEIRNLILIHFANSDFDKIPEINQKIKDPKLSEYLNQFLSKGKIEDSEYQLVRVY